MAGVCKVGDIGVGICPHHGIPQHYTTVFITGTPGVESNELENCVVGAIGVATCGHVTVAITGSDNCTSNGIGLHRIGDVGVNYGPYTAITGSSDVISE